MKTTASDYKNKGNLIEGSVAGHLIRLTLPMTWGIFAVISFQLTSLFFISYLGTKSLAAISYTIPVTYGVFSVFIGFQIAMASVVSRLIGQGDRDQVRRVVTHGLILVLILGILTAMTGIYFHDALFRAMGADEEMLPLIRDFMLIWFAGSVAVTLPMVGNAAMRADGDSMTPALIMTVAAVINVIVEPILIFGLFGFPRLEIQGAALTTVFANGGAMLAGLYILIYKRNMVCSLKDLGLDQFKNSARRLLAIALPAGLTNAIQPVVNAFIVALLSAHGTAAVAAFGIVARIEAFAFIILMALATGMAPVIGQNWGAGKFERVREALKLGIGFNIVWSLVIALILTGFAPSVARIFSHEPDIIETTALYFWIVPITFVFGNLIMGWGSAFNAMGRPERSFIMIVTKMVIILVPAVMIGDAMYGITGIFVAIALTNTLAGIGFHLVNKQYFDRATAG